jgi:hypothetical protein
MESWEPAGDVHVDAPPERLKEVVFQSLYKLLAQHPHDASRIWSRCFLVNGWSVIGRPAQRSHLAWADQRATVRPGSSFMDYRTSDTREGVVYYQSEHGKEAAQPTLTW